MIFLLAFNPPQSVVEIPSPSEAWVNSSQSEYANTPQSSDPPFTDRDIDPDDDHLEEEEEDLDAIAEEEAVAEMPVQKVRSSTGGHGMLK